MSADDDAFWDLYIDAVIDCEVDGATRSLRGPHAEALPGTDPVFVLTAYNPGGNDRDRAANEADERALEHELEQADLAFWPAIGSSRDGSWSEPGVAIAGLDRARACAYGERYGQLAVYELTAGEVRVVRCVGAHIVRTAPRRK